MRRILITLALCLAVVGAAGAVATAIGDGSTVSRARLERSLPTAFANRYLAQAELLGHRGLTAASLHPTAMCERGGPDVPDVGAGSDWVCLVGWSDPAVPMPPEGYGKFEVAVHANDCYTVSGPSKLVGFATIEDVLGRTVANPVAEFDACFDPAGDDTPTGVTYPSVLQPLSTALTVGPDGRTSVQVSCGAGAGGCAGTLTVMDGTRALAEVPYRIEEQATPTLVVPARVPAGVKTVDLVFASTVGVAPPKPVTLPVQ